MSDATSRLAAQGTPVAAPAERKGRSRVPLLTWVAALAVLGGGGSAWFVVQRGRTDQSPPKQVSSAPLYIAHLEGFTVNLADPEETHFLRVTMDLGFDHLPDGASKEKVTAAMPVARIRDSILAVLTVCKAEPLLTSEGKTQLKKNLVDSLNKAVPELAVREVYFTEFLVQR